MFEQHGNYEIEIVGHIIVFTAKGAWNVETTNACISDFKSITRQLKNRPFSMIIDSLEFEGFTADCIELWVDEIERWIACNLLAVSRIDDPGSAGYRIFITRFDKIFINRIPFSFSNDVREAIAWIEKFSINQAVG